MFTDPQKNIEELGLQPKQHVVDLGSGTGFYSVAAAKMVGEEGRVFAVDVQKDLLARVDEQAKAEGLSNVEVVWGNVEEFRGTRLRDHSIDAVILANTLFQIEDREGLLKEIDRILRQTGRVLVVDWKESFSGLGPAEEEVVKKEDAQSLFEQQGFILDLDFDAGEHHYGLIFKR